MDGWRTLTWDHRIGQRKQIPLLNLPSRDKVLAHFSLTDRRRNYSKETQRNKYGKYENDSSI